MSLKHSVALSINFIKVCAPSIEKIFGHCGMMEEIKKCNETLFCLLRLNFWHSNEFEAFFIAAPAAEEPDLFYCLESKWTNRCQFHQHFTRKFLCMKVLRAAFL
jgi:hypothetical protein